MLKVRINKELYQIPFISELTFNEFNKIFVNGAVTDLKNYIAVFIDMDIDKLMNATFTGCSMPSIHSQIFNVNIEAVLNDYKNVIEYDGSISIVDEMEHGTFGKSYFFDLYHGKQKVGNINYYELCLYALAISISPTLDEKIEEIYTGLSKKKWTEVLPQGFFLAKKFYGSRITSIRQSMICTRQLRMTESKIRSSLKKLIKQERT